MASSLPEDTVGALLSTLECPVCFEYVLPPVRQCRNGHCICNLCLEKELLICPVCKVNMENPSRSLIADKFLEDVMFPCKFCKDGCLEKQHLHDIVVHQKACRFFTQCTIESCAWRGPLASLIEHTAERHPNSVSLEEYSTLVFTLPVMPAEHVTIISAHDKLFRCYFTFEPSDNKLYGTVLYLGPYIDESSFEYQIEFWSPLGEYRLIFQQVSSEVTNGELGDNRMSVDANMLDCFYVDRADKLVTCSVRIIRN